LPSFDNEKVFSRNLKIE